MTIEVTEEYGFCGGCAADLCNGEDNMRQNLHERFGMLSLDGETNNAFCDGCNDPLDWNCVKMVKLEESR